MPWREAQSSHARIQTPTRGIPSRRLRPLVDQPATLPASPPAAQAQGIAELRIYRTVHFTNLDANPVRPLPLFPD